jgi:hypothetical protein
MRGLIADASSFNGGGGGPSLSLDFMTPGTLDPRLTFTRASTATYFDSAGVMRTAATNAPRWDYDPATLALRGLLLEDARTNALFPSVIGGANWTPLGNVVLGGSITLPDGTASTTALIRSQDTANTARQFYRTGTVITATTAYTVSAYFKASPNNAYIQANASGGTTIAGVAYFDLTAGTAVVGADLAAGMTAKSAAITNAGNGWWRCSFTFTTVAGNNALQVAVGPCVTVSASGDNRSYVGVVGQGIYAWGAQVEAGAFATSYIPTTSAAVTRALESATMPTSGGWFNAPAGTFFAEFSSANLPVPGTHSGILQVNDGTSSNQLNLYLELNSGNMIFQAVIATVAQLSVTGTSGANGNKQKVAANYGAGVWRAAYAGTVINGSGSAAPFPATTINLGTINPPSSWRLNGYLRNVRYYARALTDAELQQITAP